MDVNDLLHGILPIAGVMVAISAILLPALIVFIVLHFKQQRAARLFETVRHLADKGLPVPPELLQPAEEQRADGTPLFRAITLIGVGIGLALMFWLMGMRFLIGVGGMLMCIGVAQLVALWIERRSATPTTPAPR